MSNTHTHTYISSAEMLRLALDSLDPIQPLVCAVEGRCSPLKEPEGFGGGVRLPSGRCDGLPGGANTDFFSGGVAPTSVSSQSLAPARFLPLAARDTT